MSKIINKCSQGISGKPILFNGEMVKAILSGKKTQTRRIAKSRPVNPKKYNNGDFVETGYDDTLHFKYTNPFGQIGDRLWVRETWAPLDTAPNGVYYWADVENPKRGGWKPSIHMRKKHARIWLTITDIRIDRLQNISDEDAEKEGVDFLRYVPDVDETLTATELFMCLWDSVYTGEKCWDSNPWVFVVKFEVI